MAQDKRQHDSDVLKFLGCVTNRAQALDFAREAVPSFRGLGDNVVDPTQDNKMLKGESLDGYGRIVPPKRLPTPAGMGITDGEINHDLHIALSSADIDRLAAAIVRRWKRVQEERRAQKKNVTT